MVMGHAGAVAAVQLKKAYFLGLALDVPVSNRHVSSLAHSPTAKDVASSRVRFEGVERLHGQPTDSPCAKIRPVPACAAA